MLRPRPPLLRLNQPEKALKYFRKGPDAAAFKLTAISMFLESRHYLQAERLLKEMLDEPGVPPDVFLMLAGIARDQRRDTELALSWLARIPASSPTAVQAEGLKAQILADAGKEKEALASVRNLQQRHARNETLLLLEVRLLARPMPWTRPQPGPPGRGNRPGKLELALPR